MINLLKILPQRLKNEKPVSVSIIDSGFSNIPSYAKIYGMNLQPYHNHGNRVLSIFRALDEQFPLPNLTLNLSCYDVNTNYEGLIQALQRLPVADILSISISWTHHNQRIYDLLCEKAKIICVPYSENTKKIYPSHYNNVITCSNTVETHADYSIRPVLEWNGNSYAVPAIARLLAYNNVIQHDDGGIKVTQLFQNHTNHINKKNENEQKKNIILKCPFCLRELKTQQHTYLKEMPNKCPYCGQKIKGVENE